MEKKTEKEFTMDEIIDATRHCAHRMLCVGCPLWYEGKPFGECLKIKERLADAYEGKCKEVEDQKILLASYEEENKKIKQDNSKLEFEVAALKLRLAAKSFGVSAEKAAESMSSFELAIKVTGLEAENKKLKEEIELLIGEREMNANTAEMINDRYKELKVECDEILTTAEKLKEENEELKTANKYLVERRDILKKEIGIVRDHRDRLKEQLDDLKNELAVRNADYKKVFSEANHWMHKHETVKQELDACKAANETLKEKVAKYMREEKSSFDEIKEKLKNSKFEPIDPVSSGCTSMKPSDVADEVVKALKNEAGIISPSKFMRTDEHDRELARNIIRAIRNLYRYDMTLLIHKDELTKKKYSKNEVWALLKALNRRSVANGCRIMDNYLEEFYGK